MTTRRRRSLDSTQANGDAVLYLRVSSEGQVNTDYNPEGISIPAQREASRARARALGASVVEEFIDPGKSAKSIEHRHAFTEMIVYLKANPTVRYVIVYALSRFARDRYDDAMMMVTLQKLGVRLLSATEHNLDDTPAGPIAEVLAAELEREVAPGHPLYGGPGISSRVRFLRTRCWWRVAMPWPWSSDPESGRVGLLLGR